jgi:hypothetical protein
VQVKKRFGIKVIHFDDEIFAMDIKWLERFAIFYLVKINLPFVAYIYPTRNIAGHPLDLMKRLRAASIAAWAFESGSERMNKMRVRARLQPRAVPEDGRDPAAWAPY